MQFTVTGSSYLLSMFTSLASTLVTFKHTQVLSFGYRTSHSKIGYRKLAVVLYFSSSAQPAPCENNRNQML